MPTWSDVRSAASRALKLTAFMCAGGFGLGMVAFMQRGAPNVAAALWQGAALVGVVVLAGALHVRLRVGETLALAYLWALLLVVWMLPPITFAIETHWPEFVQGGQ